MLLVRCACSQDTASQDRFRTITDAYYRGAHGILIVYDVTDEQSFQNVRNWMQNVQQNGAPDVNKIVVGNKCDQISERVVDTARGQALANEFGLKFFETSASNNNVSAAFNALATDVKLRLGNSGAGGWNAGQQQGGQQQAAFDGQQQQKQQQQQQQHQHQQQAPGGFQSPQGRSSNTHQRTQSCRASFSFCF